MIYKIKYASQARDILRFCKNYGKPSPLIFDIDTDCHEKVPVVWRRCTHCDNDYEYMGVNIWGGCISISTYTTYCPHCGNLLYTIVCVDMVIQGDRVLNTGYRLP